jgi:hypothetical protein
MGTRGGAQGSYRAARVNRRRRRLVSLGRSQHQALHSSVSVPPQEVRCPCAATAGSRMGTALAAVQARTPAHPHTSCFLLAGHRVPVLVLLQGWVVTPTPPCVRASAGRGPSQRHPAHDHKGSSPAAGCHQPGAPGGPAPRRAFFCFCLPPSALIFYSPLLLFSFRVSSLPATEYMCSCC